MLAILPVPVRTCIRLARQRTSGYSFSGLVPLLVYCSRLGRLSVGARAGTYPKRRQEAYWP